MVTKKYQIFVSPTYTDLKDSRDVVIKAILEMGHIPVGMEMFSAADEEQWAVIRRNIEQTDYYIVIAANRYGSRTPDGISYTEKEYDYAVRTGIPTLGFVLDATTPWPANQTDTTPEAVSSLELFKEKIKKKHVSFWKSEDDLYGKCSIALSKAFTTHPRDGWVQASQLVDNKVTDELSRLSAENAALRERLEAVNIDKKREEGENERRTIKILTSNKRKMHIWRKSGTTSEDMADTTLLALFVTLAPEMMIEKSVEEMSRYAAQMICGVEAPEFRYEYPVPSNSVKGWMVDFSTLGLVMPSTRKKPSTDKHEYWTLTAKGKHILSTMRLRLLEEAADKPAPTESKSAAEKS
jgi:hypothetical protein